MQYSFQHPSHNEGSLRIYQPQLHQIISHNIFTNTDNSQPYPSQKNKSYHRQQSLIDQLQNRQQPISNNCISSNNNIYPKPTSIQFLVQQNDHRQNRFQNQINRIQDIFANKPALSSKEISSNMLLKTIHDPLFQAKLTNNPSQILLPTFPSKQYISDSPERPNLNRPFLRKKTTSKSSQGESNQTFGPATKKQERNSFEFTRIQSTIAGLKQHNKGLTAVYKNMQILQEQHQQGWRQLSKAHLQTLKLMIEKAIIRKEEYH